MPGTETETPVDKTSLTTPYFSFSQPVVPLLPTLSSSQENDQQTETAAATASRKSLLPNRGAEQTTEDVIHRMVIA